MSEQLSVEILTWRDIREEAGKVRPEFAAIIDSLDPSSQYKIVKARFPFGSKIIQDGKFCLPNSHGKLVPLDDKSLDPFYREELSYNAGTNPVSLVLKNSLEIFLPVNAHTVSLFGMINPGAILSTSRVLSTTLSQSPAFLWDMTAGARSLFMLPKISEQTGFKNLRKHFATQFEKPKSLFDHWQLFKNLYDNAESKKQTWAVECIYFTKSWIDALQDPAWLKLRNFLLQKAWDGSEFFRNQFVWDMVFSLIQQKRCIKIDPYIADTVKHLLFMASGSLPGFAPAIDDQTAPVALLQEIFTDIYKLEYTPTLMAPKMFNVHEERAPIYYSLEYPALFKFSPKNRAISSKISDLYDVKLLLDKYTEEIMAGDININDTQLQKALKNVEFNFFHSTINSHYKGLKLSDQLSQHDKNLLFCSDGKSTPRPLATNSTFLRGCIQIGKNHLF